MIHTPLCDLLGIQYPVFQGGMAWIADGKLAAAVSEGGGLGILAAGNAPGDYVREQIRIAKSLTQRPFGVNIMLMSPFVEEVAQVVAEEKVAVVTTGAGNPTKFMAQWKEAGIKVIPVVASVAMAKLMTRLGASALIAEGGESGGHVGELTTMVLVPQVCDATDLPVIAAGGIADGRGVAAAFMLGACGVQMGTRFLSAEECSILVEEYKAKKAKFLEEKAALQKFVGQKSQTADGHVVELVANIGGPDEAEGVLERDGEGVGLFRSEFLFMESDAIPSEEAQFEAYKKVAETLDGKPVIIRTLDIGGDKALPYLGLPTEENPFLGFRAVRFCLQRKEDIYKPQLRALLRASAFGKVRIMVPLVTCVDELRAVKAIIEELKQELDAEGIAYDKDIQVGVMMETAAASLIADILAKEADFFSIGTNDLTGYTMAADRGNPDVAYLYSAYNPAVLRSIRNIISAANKEDIMAGMCGEAASDPLLVPVLLGFGLNEFSVSATAILATRKVMSLWTMDECKALVDEVMQLETEAEVKALLEERASLSKWAALKKN